MTWTWTIPIRIPAALAVWSPILDSRQTRTIVPTYRDWNAARATVDSLMECRPRPAEIVLVNDNEEPDPPAWLRRYPIRYVSCGGNRGPSFARNAGARLITGLPVQWLYFTDTGCLRDPWFFAALSEVSREMPRTTVAIAGPIRGMVKSQTETPINLYMTEETILNPPFDEKGPQAIVTANAAVSYDAFAAIGGFDSSYPFAAGEDLDLGLRLRLLGSIGWADQAVVYHPFSESVGDFRHRFLRYGAGNAHLEHRLALPRLTVTKIVARSTRLQRLADIQVKAMQEGYGRHRCLLAGVMKPQLSFRRRREKVS